jgi:hypothetical protein
VVLVTVAGVGRAAENTRLASTATRVISASVDTRAAEAPCAGRMQHAGGATRRVVDPLEVRVQDGRRLVVVEETAPPVVEHVAGQRAHLVVAPQEPHLGVSGVARVAKGRCGELTERARDDVGEARRVLDVESQRPRIRALSAGLHDRPSARGSRRLPGKPCASQKSAAGFFRGAPDPAGALDPSGATGFDAGVAEGAVSRAAPRSSAGRAFSRAPSAVRPGPAADVDALGGACRGTA